MSVSETADAIAHCSVSDRQSVAADFDDWRPRALSRPPLLIGGGQRPNLKSEDSGLRACFSGAKVSLWMCENGTGHEEARGPTRR